MTTNRRTDVNLNVGADVTNAMSGLRRIQQEALQTQRRLDQATGGNLSRGGRIGGALGRGAATGVGIVGAGAGLSAGLAVLEQLVEKLIELFEGTDIFENFTEALQSLLQALAPVIGVLIRGLTPALEALRPLIEQLAIALSPVIEQLTLGLTDLIAALVPVLIPAIQVLGVGLQVLATIVRQVAAALSGIISIIPGRSTASGSGGTAYQIATRQLAEARQERLAQENPTIDNRIETRVVVDGQTIENTALRRRRLNVQYGKGIN